MRAFTTLAGHILGSNPAINGYFEMHLSYADSSVLDHQLVELQKHEELKDNSLYLFDKLLHNDYQLSLEQLSPVTLKILVALREPESTIKSIVDLFEKRQKNHIYASPEEATRYYIERLEWLADFCRRRDQGYCYFDAQLIQTAPELLLPTLTDWLGLETPLSEQYQLFSQTGKARKGDSSRSIHSGKVVNSRTNYTHIHIPRQLLKTAQTVYQDCRQQIIKNATYAITQ